MKICGVTADRTSRHEGVEMRTRSAALVMVVGLSISLCSCSMTTPAAKTTTTTAIVPAKALGNTTVALSVSPCSSTSGAPTTGPPWRPSKLLGLVPADLVSKVEFYSSGTETLLGPRGWSCSQVTGADGSSEMAVYPLGNTDPTSEQIPAGTIGVFAGYDYTGHNPGIDTVCPYFPVVDPSQYGCAATTPPNGEQTHMLTPDVVAITDPAGVTGGLTGSGGNHAVIGVLIFPQVTPRLSSEDTAEVSCSLSDSSLCPAILADFEVRQLPVPTTPVR